MIVLLIVLLSSPAVVPAAVVSTVLGSDADLFNVGSGEISGGEWAEFADDLDARCDRVASSGDLPVEVPTQGAAAIGGGDSTDVSAMTLGEGGRPSRDDVAQLLEPLPMEANSLLAHVWFLYRLAGLGDWDRFAADYAAAGLSEEEDSPDAPLRQVQELNAVGVEMEPYRLTAAALVGAGQQTGRFVDPYPRYRELVAVELLSSCHTGTDAEDSRMTLPPPRIAPTAAAPGAGSAAGSTYPGSHG